MYFVRMARREGRRLLARGLKTARNVAGSGASASAHSRMLAGVSGARLGKLINLFIRRINIVTALRLAHGTRSSHFSTCLIVRPLASCSLLLSFSVLLDHLADAARRTNVPGGDFSPGNAKFCTREARVNRWALNVAIFYLPALPCRCYIIPAASISRFDRAAAKEIRITFWSSVETVTRRIDFVLSDRDDGERCIVRVRVLDRLAFERKNIVSCLATYFRFFVPNFGATNRVYPLYSYML